MGEDLVAMVVDDLVVCGAEPLFLTDYIAVGKVIPERIAEIVGGIARGCAWSRTALIGGETAEHPQLLKEDEFDLAAAATGVVEHEKLLGEHLVKVGDIAIAIESSGVHANGFSLVRHILKNAKLDLNKNVAELGTTLGEALLEPTTIYAPTLLDLIEDVEVHAMAHITGGGLAANTARVMPKELQLTIDRSTWALPELFKFLAAEGQVEQPDLERTFNCGVGMVLLLPPGSVDATIARLTAKGLRSWASGKVVHAQNAPGGVALEGKYGTL
jgi:phosphoribosylformylglycinamidine cyclo-ligase